MQVSRFGRAPTSPEVEYPCLRDSVDALTECEDVEGYFRSGTQLFLAGVEALQTRLPKRG